MVANKAKAALRMEPVAVEAYDAGCFLAAMLKRVKAESGKGCRIGVIENAENSALFMQPVCVDVQVLSAGCAHAGKLVQP